jgi:hypothetical protein
MAIETKTVTTVTCICDKCGAQEDKGMRDKKPDGSYLNVVWAGTRWSTCAFGNKGGVSLDDRAYLCEKCTNDFLEFMGKK